MSDLNNIFRTALDVQAFCKRMAWRHCFIGGIAVQRWGEPRVTVDVDLTVLTGFGGEEQFIDRLCDRYRGRRPDTRDFALASRVVLLESDSGTSIDVALGAIPFEERSIERASPFDFGRDCALVTCSAEDLVVHKCFANRDRDWADVEGVLMRCRGQLDLELIKEELSPLAGLKEEPQIMTKLTTMVDRLSK